MKTIEIKVYTFDELSDKAKEKAIENMIDINVDYDWWESVYDDAENIGLKITSFDLDRQRHAKGEFIVDALECAHKITAEHGKICETFKTAQDFLAERDENGDFVDEGELDSLLDECETEFLQSIVEDYSIILQKESEYLQSDESIIETIQANGCEFLEDGTMY